MDSIFNKGDKYIYFKDNGEIEIGEVKNIAISQVSGGGYCYEVVNLITKDNNVISLFQTTRGRVYKLNYVMTEEENKLFEETGEFRKDFPNFPTRYE